MDINTELLKQILAAQNKTLAMQEKIVEALNNLGNHYKTQDFILKQSLSKHNESLCKHNELIGKVDSLSKQSDKPQQKSNILVSTNMIIQDTVPEKVVDRQIERVVERPVEKITASEVIQNKELPNPAPQPISTPIVEESRKKYKQSPVPETYIKSYKQEEPFEFPDANEINNILEAKPQKQEPQTLVPVKPKKPQTLQEKLESNELQIFEQFESDKPVVKTYPVIQFVKNELKKEMYMANVTIFKNGQQLHYCKTDTKGKWQAALSPGKYIVKITRSSNDKEYKSEQEIWVQEETTILPMAQLQPVK